MKIVFFVTLCFITLSISCKEKETEASNKLIIETNTSKDFTETELSEIDFIEFTLDNKTKKAIENWHEYNQLQDIVNSVKKGDFSFFSNNTEDIKTLFKDLSINIPEAVNSNATLARILALKTKAYKLGSLSNLSTTKEKELNLTIQEFIESFSNLNFQMNKKLEKEKNFIQKP